jgi:hypothetical protein
MIHDLAPLVKEVAHLKRAAANQEIELAKANARAKAYKQVLAVTYSATASQYPPAGSQAAAAAPLPQRQGPPPHRPGPAPDLASVLLMLVERMAAMETRFLHTT